jgi:hypothetical protein
MVPAEKEGLFGAADALVGQLPPAGALVIAKESDGCASGVSGALQGAMSEVVE